MSGIETFRKWLQRNKIFFEIIVALSLTTMSVIVANNANQIAATQNQIMKEENQPIFIFDTRIPDNDTSNVMERVKIDNIGKPAYYFFAEPYVLYDIQVRDNDYNIKKNAIIPVVDFYSYSETSGFTSGNMESFYRENLTYTIRENNSSTKYYTNDTMETLYKINGDLGSYTKNRNDMFVDLYIYIHITYQDVYGDSHDEIYCIDSYGLQSKLSEHDKIHLEMEYKKQILQDQFISDVMYIPPNEIINHLSNSSFGDYILPRINDMYPVQSYPTQIIN